jgi:hypothetical protein
MKMRSQRQRQRPKQTTPRTAFKCAFLFSRCLLCAFAFLVLLSPSSMPLGVVTIFEDDAGPAMSRRKKGEKVASGWWGARLVIALPTSFCPGVTAAVREKASASGKQEEVEREGKEARQRKETNRSVGRRGDYRENTEVRRPGVGQRRRRSSRGDYNGDSTDDERRPKCRFGPRGLSVAVWGSGAGHEYFTRVQRME